MAKYELRVEVQPEYLPDQSAPEEGLYTFAYTITITNSGDVPAQLQAQVSGPVQITVLSPPTSFVARDRYKLNLQFSVINLANKVALYNFLSTFSGTHFVTPRAWQGQIKLVF